MLEENEHALMEKMKKDVLRKALSKSALERLGRVRMANATLAAQVEMYLMQLYQAGQLKEEIDDNRLRTILELLTAKKKETNIKFQR